MSFRDDEELDWGEEDYRNPALDEGDADVVDTVSLGDEEEIMHPSYVTESEVEASVRATTPERAREPPTSPNKNRSGNGLSHSSALGLSHLPPKPRTVVSGGRSRETIKAAAMSRPPPRSHSPPVSTSNDLPHNWEKPTRDDARLDLKSSWSGEAPPPPGLIRSLSGRNAPSSRAAWPERSSPDHQAPAHRRALTPPPRAASPPARGPTSPEDDPQRGRSNSVQQPQRPRSISPASMLLPRRGQSPARGLAKNGNDLAEGNWNEPLETNYSDDGRTDDLQQPRREAWDRRTDRDAGPPPPKLDHYSPEPEPDERSARTGRAPRDAGVSQDSRVVGSRRPRPEVTSTTRAMDHYSPPPEAVQVPPKPGPRRRSVSPSRRSGMRSDSMAFDQYAARRSVSPPQRHRESRNFERPTIERTHSDSRIRPDSARARSNVDILKERDSARPSRDERFGEHPRRHENGEFMDPRQENFRERDIRPSPRGRLNELGIPPRHLPGPAPMHGRDPEVFVRPDDEETMYRNGPSGLHSRVERFHGRNDGPRPPRGGPMHPTLVDAPMDSPRLSPHAVRNDASLPPRHDRNFEPHGSYPRDQRPTNAMHHGHDVPPHVRERRRSPRENEFMGPNRNFVPPGPPRHELAHPREPHPHGHPREPPFQDRTSTTWERGVEVPTPPSEQAHYDGRRQEGGGRQGRQGSGPESEYPGPRHSQEEEPLYQDERSGPAPRGRFGRQAPLDAQRSYPANEREWAPRPVVPTAPSRGPPRMDMEVDPDPSLSGRAEQLPGWVGFRRRDHGEPVHERRAWAPKPWAGGPEGDQDQMGESDEESRKRRKVEGGTEVTSTFSRNEQELPRKIPHYSPVQRSKPQPPVNSFPPLPNPVTSTPPVDIQAARARAMDVASQITRANSSASKPKSRFGALPPAAAMNILVAAPVTAPAAPVAPELPLKPETEPNPAPAEETPNAAEMPEIVIQEAPAQKGMVSVETGKDSPSHKSDDSSAPLVTQLGGATIGESERTDVPQISTGRPPYHQNNRWKPQENRDRLNNRVVQQRHGDVWRPENDDAPRDSPMRAWGKPNHGGQRDGPPNQPFVPGFERYVPRHAQQRTLMPREGRNHLPNIHDGLPPRPLGPEEYFSMPNAGSTRRPPQLGGRQPPVAESDTHALSKDNHNLGSSVDIGGANPEWNVSPDQARQGSSNRASGGISFLSASSASDTPRKNSLLNRMTEPGGGELTLMARLSAGDEAGNNDSQTQRQRRQKFYKTGPRR